MEKISEFLNQFLDKNEIVLNNSYNSFFKSWDKIAGEQLSDYTKVIDINRNQLIVQVSHPGWLQMFQFKEKKILKNIQKEYPELKIKAIKLVLSDQKEKKVMINNGTEEIKMEEFKEKDKKMFEKINNKELKNKLEKLYFSALKKNKQKKKED